MPAPRLFPTVSCLAASLVIAACTSIPAEQLDLWSAAGSPQSVSLQCGRASAMPGSATDAALDPESISILSWNMHKGIDPGWQQDLAVFAHAHTLVLLQEASLAPELQTELARSGHTWTLASAFALNGNPTGVLTASMAAPVAACSLRHDEPLLALPKAASVTRYRVAGRDDILTVANIHAVNFALTLDSYAAQFDALANELAIHPGPMILAGDFNTWNEGRRDTVERITARLGLKEVPLEPDHRRRFLGKQVDHVYVRGLQPVQARAIEVRSSDHNPVSATLRIDASAGGRPPAVPARASR